MGWSAIERSHKVGLSPFEFSLRLVFRRKCWPVLGSLVDLPHRERLRFDNTLILAVLMREKDPTTADIDDLLSSLLRELADPIQVGDRRYHVHVIGLVGDQPVSASTCSLTRIAFRLNDVLTILLGTQAPMVVSFVSPRRNKARRPSADSEHRKKIVAQAHEKAFMEEAF